MKIAYFGQASADEDDVRLRAAKDDGIVPATCLLGGHLIDTARRRAVDPCGECFGPRSRCKGRERNPDPEPDSELVRALNDYRAAITEGDPDVP